MSPFGSELKMKAFLSILCCFLRDLFRYREEEKSYCFTDRKSTARESASTSSSISHNRMTTPANPWVEQDSNSGTNRPFAGSNSAEREITTFATSGKPEESDERDIEIEAAAHLLTKQEKTLCIQLDLKPTQYLTQKALLLQVKFLFF